MENKDINNQHHNGGEDKLPPLNLPRVNLKLARVNNHICVFDNLRDKFVALTPEEYVRQHFVHWLQSSLHYPSSLMANEVGISVNDCRRRCDTVVYNSDGSLLLIVEYKAPNIPVTQAVFDQIVRYNMALKARYLIVSNGINHYCCAIDYKTGSYHFIPAIPDYRQLKHNISDN